MTSNHLLSAALKALVMALLRFYNGNTVEKELQYNEEALRWNASQLTHEK